MTSRRDSRLARESLTRIQSIIHRTVASILFFTHRSRSFLNCGHYDSTLNLSRARATFSEYAQLTRTWIAAREDKNEYCESSLCVLSQFLQITYARTLGKLTTNHHEKTTFVKRRSLEKRNRAESSRRLRGIRNCSMEIDKIIRVQTLARF